ncbi:hypothetical protein D3C81_1605120 [compost metagenome]
MPYDVTFTKAQATAFEATLKLLGEEELVRKHADRDTQWTSSLSVALNDIPLKDIYHAVTNGYNVELTEEEQVLGIYNNPPMPVDSLISYQLGVHAAIGALKKDIKLPGIDFSKGGKPQC